MENTLSSNLIKVRMLLENLCDGFDSSCSSKQNLLTTKIKVLYLLEQEKKISPSLIINKIGVAKSNLAILAGNMIKEALIQKEIDTFDRRVIYYIITQKGKTVLQNELKKIDEQVCDCALGGNVCTKLNQPLKEIIKILS